MSLFNFKKTKNHLILFFSLVLIGFFSLFLPLNSNAGCVICDGADANDGWCAGEEYKSCVDESSWTNPKCKIGITSTTDCGGTIEG